MTSDPKTAMPIGRTDLGPTEPRRLTQTEQRAMDAALRRSVVLLPDPTQSMLDAGKATYLRHLDEIADRYPEPVARALIAELAEWAPQTVLDIYGSIINGR